MIGGIRISGLFTHRGAKIQDLLNFIPTKTKKKVLERKLWEILKREKIRGFQRSV